jgi:hypothetical protein
MLSMSAHNAADAVGTLGPNQLQLRIARDSEHGNRTDSSNKLDYIFPWTLNFDENHFISCVFKVDFSQQWGGMNDRWTPYGGKFQAWVSIDGGPYVIAPDIWGEDVLNTQTWNEGTNNYAATFAHLAEIYSTRADLPASGLQEIYGPPMIGKTFASADMFRKHSAPEQ